MSVHPLVEIAASVALDPRDVEISATTAGGPGGQHANTSDTRVEVRFPIATSTSLGPRQRARLLDKLGPVARATASDSRAMSPGGTPTGRAPQRYSASMKPG